MRIYTIYEKPADYPNYFVVRGFTIGSDKGGTIVPDKLTHAVEDTLEEARKSIPQGMFCMPSKPGTEEFPCIVEVWI